MHLNAEEVKEKISVNTDTSRIPLDKRFGRGLVVYRAYAEKIAPTIIPDKSRKILSEARSSASPQLLWLPESGIKKAHDWGYKGKGVLVGVLDTGIDADHEEFFHKNNIQFRYFPPDPQDPTERLASTRNVRGFDPGGHGTLTCGVIAGKNVGIAPEVDLYVASVIESGRAITSFNRISRGLNWLLEEFTSDENINKPAIINMSLGFPHSEIPFEMTRDTYDLYIGKMQGIIQELLTKSVLLVSGIGKKTLSYPGAFPEVLGVGCVGLDENQNLFLSELSGSGNPEEGISKPDLVGYGVDIWSCSERDIDGNSFYQKTSGTSIAAAYVTGIAALYLSQNPLLTLDEVKQKIIDNILPLDHLSQDEVGKGLVRFIP